MGSISGQGWPAYKKQYRDKDGPPTRGWKPRLPRVPEQHRDKDGPPTQ